MATTTMMMKMMTMMMVDDDGHDDGDVGMVMIFVFLRHSLCCSAAGPRRSNHTAWSHLHAAYVWAPAYAPWEFHPLATVARDFLRLRAFADQRLTSLMAKAQLHVSCHQNSKGVAWNVLEAVAKLWL